MLPHAQAWHGCNKFISHCMYSEAWFHRRFGSKNVFNNTIETKYQKNVWASLKTGHNPVQADFLGRCHCSGRSDPLIQSMTPIKWRLAVPFNLPPMLTWHDTVLRIWRVADKTCNGVLNEMAMSMAKLLQKHQTRVTLDLQSENAHKLYRLK